MEAVLSAKHTAQRIIDLAREKKGKQIVKMGIGTISSFADYFVIITGESGVQIKAIADHIDNELRLEDIYPSNKEGYQNLSWVLMDYGDVIVHIFNHESREFYAIERLWADAEMEFISDEEA